MRKKRVSLLVCYHLLYQSNSSLHSWIWSDRTVYFTELCRFYSQRCCANCPCNLN